jgi:hypothetical protein
MSRTRCSAIQRHTAEPGPTSPDRPRLSGAALHAALCRGHGSASSARLFVLVAVLLLFLLFLVVVAVCPVALVINERVRIAIVLNRSFQRLALGGFALALTAPLVPSVEELLQLGEHLFDRRQLTGRAGLAARALRTVRSSRSARSGFALFALRPSFARCSRLALRAGLAARAVRAAPPRMPLRSRPSGFTLLATRTRRSLSSLPALIVCRATAPATVASYLAAIHDSSNCAASFWRA